MPRKSYRVEDALLLSNIKHKHAYYDKKSIESSTGIKRKKYKLAGIPKPILDNYFFLVLTKRKTACNHNCTLRIEQHHWENKSKSIYLQEPVTYCDLTKYEWLTGLDILDKMKDIDNKFDRAAKLCEDKCQELEVLRVNINRNDLVSEETKNIINQGLSESIDNLVLKLNI